MFTMFISLTFLHLLISSKEWLKMMGISSVLIWSIKRQMWLWFIRGGDLWTNCMTIHLIAVDRLLIVVELLEESHRITKVGQINSPGTINIEHIMAIHPRVSEIFQFGPTRWANRLTDIFIHVELHCKNNAQNRSVTVDGTQIQWLFKISAILQIFYSVMCYFCDSGV